MTRLHRHRLSARPSAGFPLTAVPKCGRIPTFVLGLLGFCAPPSQGAEWSDWKPVTGTPGVVYATKVFQDNPKDRSAVTVYWKFKSNYPEQVEVTVTFSEENNRTEECLATLAPGVEKKLGGWWTAWRITNATGTFSATVPATVSAAHTGERTRLRENGHTPAIALWLAATQHDGTVYGKKGLHCNELIIAACEKAGIPIRRADTADWFANGMGKNFRPFDLGAREITLQELATRSGNGTLKIPIGAVIVADGHAAIYAGDIKLKKQWEIITYDANDSEGWTVSTLNGGPVKEDSSKKQTIDEMEFPGHVVGEHVTSLQWGGWRPVKVFVPTDE